MIFVIIMFDFMKKHKHANKKKEEEKTMMITFLSH